MKSKKYLFLNSYRIIITLTLILLVYLIYNFSNNRFTIIEGANMITNTNQAKDEIEKAAKKEEDKHKGDVMKNQNKYLDMHDRAF
jgi:amino acid permease